MAATQERVPGTGEPHDGNWPSVVSIVSDLPSGSLALNHDAGLPNEVGGRLDSVGDDRVAIRGKRQ